MTPDELRARCREFVSVNCDSGKVVSIVLGVGIVLGMFLYWCWSREE